MTDSQTKCYNRSIMFCDQFTIHGGYWVLLVKSDICLFANIAIFYGNGSDITIFLLASLAAFFVPLCSQNGGAALLTAIGLHV